MRLQGTVDRFNNCVLGLRDSPRFGAAVRRHLTIVTYTGRRSGKTFSTPVGYKRDGDVVVIGVRMPDAKKWWRNFLGEGSPLAVQIDDVERTGHAVAHRDEKGRVAVTVRLDPPGAGPRC